MTGGTGTSGADARPVALVTGSSSGIGEAIARRLAVEGMLVVVHSRSSVVEGEALAAEIGGSYVRADLRAEDEARHLVRTVLERHQCLDVLVNNAGVSWRIPHADLAAATPEVWRELFATNVVGPWILVQEAAEALARSDNGCIVNISSHAGSRPLGASVPYAVSKAALDHMTRLLAVTLGPVVRVNAVAPGLVETERTAGWLEYGKLWRDVSPMRRPAALADVADAVWSVVSSRYLTGEVVLLDGGMNLR